MLTVDYLRRIALRLWTQSSIAVIAIYKMLVVFGEHDEARSRVSIFSVEQVWQNPGVVHLQAAERVLQYVRCTNDQGITYCDLGAEVKNKLIGWVDSDFGRDPDTRKSMTGYLMSLNATPQAALFPGDQPDKRSYSKQQRSRVCGESSWPTSSIPS
jgi:hypothetical protein